MTFDPRLAQVAADTGATITHRQLTTHPNPKLVGLHIEVVELGDQLAWINPITGNPERLSAGQVGRPLTRKDTNP